MTSPIDPIAEAITSLYAEAGLTPPSIAQPITPLGSLLRNVGLIGVELVGLTVATASDFLLKRGGAVEPLPPLTKDALAGFLCWVPNYGGCVFVERHDIFARRRFSVAHELGHYLLHFRPRLSKLDQPILDALPLTTDEDTELSEMQVGQMSVADKEVIGPAFEEMEREANEFAANLLMPANVVRALSARYQPYLSGNDLALRLAGDLFVSRAAARWRLRGLGFSLPPQLRDN